MKSLAVTIITFNEEKNIERCLKSVQGIADEIVVVDSFSQDETASICKRYNVKFVQRAFAGYSDQKNFAANQTDAEYILSLDADEALSTELLDSISKEKEKGFTADAFIMNRCTSFCGHWIKHGSWYPDKKLRLYNKIKGGWGALSIHEKIDMDTDNVQTLKGDILHYSYYTLSEVIIQNNKFTTIQSEAMFKAGKKASWFKIVVNPLVAFINGYIFKLGFLDGIDGFFIASSVAYQTMVKYAKLNKLYQNKFE